MGRLPRYSTLPTATCLNRFRVLCFSGNSIYGLQNREQMLKIELAKVIEAAEQYIDKGWWVLPCLPKSKEPHFGLIKRAYLDATNDIETVKLWAKLDPNMNVGINAIKSGLVILDIDFRNGGEIDLSWDKTYTIKTGDGFHLYYQDTHPGQYRSSLTGVDIKYKGYVVAAPSIHPSGHHYEIVDESPVAPLPKQLEETICRFQF